MFEIRTFGGVTFRKDDQPVRGLRSHKALALMAYLGVEGGDHRRQSLSSLFWPQSDQLLAAKSLRVALSKLRLVLGNKLRTSHQVVSLDPGADMYIDALDLIQKYAAGCYEQVVRLFEGPFLAGFQVAESEAFETWRGWQQEYFQRLVTESLHHLISQALDCGDDRRCIDWVHRLLKLDPLDEFAHQNAMIALVRSGQRAAALSQFKTYRHNLHAELGVEPSQPTLDLIERIRQGEDLPQAHRAPVNQILPPPQTLFIGRERELAAINERLLDPSSRLITIVGPGGIGKSHLALQALRSNLDHCPDGGYFVPLSMVTNVEFILPEIAKTLRFHVDSMGAGAAPIEQLLDYLAARRLLLVLDEFDHLVKGSDLIQEVILRAPGVKILITSRERLQLQGEWVLQIKGLPLLAEESERNEVSDALTLFDMRASQTLGLRQLPSEDRDDALEICRLVEGSPLAIELAASWTGALSCREIAFEIEHDLDFLASARRDLPQVHRSMRAVFDRSWDLLEPSQRDLFSRLSIFQGGFERSVARELLGAEITQLAALMDKSLLRRNPLGRFTMHPLLQHFASEKLAEAPVLLRTIQQKHSRYYLHLLSREGSEGVRSHKDAEYDALAREVANIRAALTWGVVHERQDEARQTLRYALAFYIVHGWFEGYDTFDHLGSLIQSVSSGGDPEKALELPIYLSARIHQAFFAANLGMIEESERISRACLEPLRAAKMDTELSMCLHNLGLNAGFRGEYDAAIPWLEESITLARENPNPAWPTYLLWLGYFLCVQGAFDEGMAKFEESYRLFEADGILWGIGFALSKMGLAWYERGDFTLAMDHHRRALEIFRQTGETVGEAYTLSRMCVDACGIGAYEDAVRFGQQGLSIFQKVDHRWGIPITRCRLAFAHLGGGEVDVAKTLLEDALTDSLRYELVPVGLFALTGLACAFAAGGNLSLAQEIISHIRNHPQLPSSVLDLAQPWIGEWLVSDVSEIETISWTSDDLPDLKTLAEPYLKSASTSELETAQTS
ncbi:MAG: BTAD domain-containing putative transcriptional regulator [Anaerolineales bacterium]